VSLEPVHGLTVKEAAFVLNVSEKTVYGWCQNKKIDYFKVVGSIRIPTESVNFILRSS